MENEVCQVLLPARPETRSALASPGSRSSQPLTSSPQHPPPFLTQQEWDLEPCPTSGPLHPSLLLLGNKGHTHVVTASI